MRTDAQTQNTTGPTTSFLGTVRVAGEDVSLAWFSFCKFFSLLFCTKLEDKHSECFPWVLYIYKTWVRETQVLVCPGKRMSNKSVRFCTLNSLINQWILNG